MQNFNGRKITSAYGMRVHPISGANKIHEGIDLAYGMDEPVKAFAPGKVTFVGNDPKGYGNYLKYLDDSGNEHLMGHFNSISKKMGDLINIDDVIGLAGATGSATGPHIHYGTYNKGKALDPMTILAANNKPVLNKNLGTTGAAADISPEVLEGYAQKVVGDRQLEQSPEDKEAKQQALQAIMQGISPIERPQFMTLQDALDKPQGERGNEFFKYMNTSPAGQKVMNGIAQMISGGRVDTVTPMEMKMKEEQARVDALNKDRLKLAFDLYKEGKFDERALKDLVYKYENMDTNASLRRDELGETTRHNKSAEDLGNRKLAQDESQFGRELGYKYAKEGSKSNSNPYNLTNSTLAKVEQEEISNNNILERMTVLSDLIAKGGNHFGVGKGIAMNSGKLGLATLNKLDPEGVDARRLFAQQRDETIKAITGAQMSEAETKRLIQQMPSEFDSPEIMKKKIKSIADDIERKSKNNQRLLGRSLGADGGNNQNNTAKQSIKVGNYTVEEIN